MAVRDARSSAEALTLLASHAEHPSTLKATKAREQFFPLLEAVVLDPTAVVFVEHKDLPGRGMLVGEQYQEYVRKLERAVRALVGPPPATAFRLAGSLTLVTDDGEALDDALQQLRTGQARDAAGKFADL